MLQFVLYILYVNIHMLVHISSNVTFFRWSTGLNLKVINIFVFRMLKLKDSCPHYLCGIFVTKDFVRNTRGSSDIFILKDNDPTGCKFGNNSIASKMVKNWNDLPTSLRYLENLDNFKKILKHTILKNGSQRRDCDTCLICCIINVYFYLINIKLDRPP